MKSVDASLKGSLYYQGRKPGAMTSQGLKPGLLRAAFGMTEVMP
jgi:hypothetical protein